VGTSATQVSVVEDERGVAITRRTDTLILLSGGIDSATGLALAVEQAAVAECLFIDYGQAAAAAEAKASDLVAAHFEVPYRKIACEGLRFGSGEIRGRNAFLLHTAMMAFSGETGVVTLGVHAGTPYRDCSPAFVATMRASYDFHTDGRIGISAPFIGNVKNDVLELAQRLNVPIALTHSCEASDTPCLTCQSCRDREVLVART